MIQELMQDRIIVNRIDLKESIYVYSKISPEVKRGGPPLYINKKTGEYKFLFVADLNNGHDDLREYFFNIT
ncbi:hypothetical protein [Aquimarina litoralis]